MEVVKYVAFFIWTLASVFVSTYFIGLKYNPPAGKTAAKNVRIVVVSVASEKVRNALFTTLGRLKSMGFKPIVLVDEGAQLIPELRSAGYELVIVPSEYRKDLVGKGRAINYFIENYVADDMWYSFLDDDNILLDTKFLYEIPEAEKRGYVAMNPVLVPRLGKSKVAFVMDWIRYLDDLSIFRFFTGVLGRPLIGMHGELLTVKGSVLKEIGFGTPSITEDFLFSAKLVSKGYRTWQSRTRISILSPNSIADFMKQRSRWYKGILQDLAKKEVPTVMKAIVGTRMTMWTLGIFASWALMPLWVYWGVWYFALPGAVAYWSTYIYGSKKLGELKYILLVPLYSVLEAISWVHVFKERGFVVIDKN